MRLTDAFLRQIAMEARQRTARTGSYAPALAERYGVSKRTVERWHHLAIQRGLVESPGKGGRTGLTLCPCCGGRGRVERAQLSAEDAALAAQTARELGMSDARTS